uniref:glycine zipper 2TM domain-containing protein n=1 Tax=uncultured Caulobacter sp. TaxID=158749 RepID=UPI0025D8B384|nr:glycine zipper 2TM domain-containing protein [uncultured Caulobacter sp.]
MRARLKTIVLATVVGFTVSSVAVTAAEAQQRRERVLVCNKSKAKNGAIIGGLGGALLGNTVAARGNKTEGALLGGAVGAVAGHEIGKNKRKCYYDYRYR